MLSILVVEIKTLTKTPTFQSIQLCGPFLTLHRSVFSPAPPLQAAPSQSCASPSAPHTKPPTRFSLVQGQDPFSHPVQLFVFGEDISSFLPYCKLLKDKVCAFLNSVLPDNGTWLMFNRCLINEWIFQWKRDKFNSFKIRARLLMLYIFHWKFLSLEQRRSFIQLRQ